MTGDKTQFTSLKLNDEEYVTFGDNGKRKIIGIGSIGKNSSSSIENILLIKGLKHNLLSISQLYNKGYKVVFESSKCEVIDINNTKIILTRHK